MAVSKNQSTSKAKRSDAGFFCYIGPTVFHRIYNGTVYRTGEEAGRAAAAFDDMPEVKALVKQLIVHSASLPKARLEIKQTRNAKRYAYDRILLAFKKK